MWSSVGLMIMFLIVTKVFQAKNQSILSFLQPVFFCINATPHFNALQYTQFMPVLPFKGQVWVQRVITGKRYNPQLYICRTMYIWFWSIVQSKHRFLKHDNTLKCVKKSYIHSITNHSLFVKHCSNMIFAQIWFVNVRGI